MQSKISFFNVTVFKNNTSRYWPIWGSYLAIMLFAFPIFLLQEYAQGYVPTGTEDILNLNATLFEMLAVPFGVVMALIFAILMAMALFSYLYTPKSAGMVGSFPITRREMFFTSYLTGVIWFAGANFVTAVLLIIAEMIAGVLMAGCVVQMFVAATLIEIFFFSLAAFCAALTGHVMILPVFYGIFNCVFIVFEWLIRNIANQLIFGFTNNAPYKTIVVTPVSELFRKSVYGCDKAGKITDVMENVVSIKYDGWGYLAAIVIVGLILVAISVAIIKYRHMETVSDVVAVKPLRPVFKFCVAIGCAVTLGYAFYVVFFEDRSTGGFFMLGLSMAVFAILGHYAADMLVQKSFRVFKNWQGPVIAAAVVMVCVCLLNFDVFGYEKKVPDAGDVYYVSISSNGDKASFKSTENVQKVIDIQKEIIADKKYIEENQFNYNSTDRFETRYVYFRYYDENGSEILTRAYSIPFSRAKLDDTEDYQHALQKIVNSEEAARSKYNLDGEINHIDFGYADSQGEYHYIDLTEKQMNELFNECIVPDILDGNIGDINFYGHSDEYECTLEVELLKKGENMFDYGMSRDYEYISVRLTEKAERTVKYLEDELGAELHKRSEYKG